MSDAKEHMNIFFSYCTRDRHLARPIVQALKQRIENVEVFFDESEIHTGEIFQKVNAALDRCNVFVFYLGPAGIGNWHDKELGVAFDRYCRQDVITIVPVLAEQLDGYRALPALARIFPAITVGSDANSINNLVQVITAGNRLCTYCPFVGAAPIDVEQSHLFFGRDKYVNTLIKTVRDHRFVVVAGDSGLGKSSLVRAGFLPEFLGGALDAPHVAPPERYFLISKPDNDFFRSTMEGLAKLNHQMRWTANAILERDASAEHNRAQLINALGRSIGDKLEVVWFIDQFEELILNHKAELRAKAIQFLLLAQEISFLRIVISVRSDCIGLFAEYGQLYAKLIDEDARVLLAPMSDIDITEVITKSLRFTEYRQETNELVDRVARDIAGNSSRLTLLQLALHLAWQRAPHGGIVRAYRGVDSALTEFTERAHQLPELESVCVRLVDQVGDQTRVLRRRADRSEFDDEQWKTAHQLASLEFGALVSIGTNERQESYAELSHDSLLKNWIIIWKLITDKSEQMQALFKLRQKLERWDGETTLDVWGAKRAAQPLKDQRWLSPNIKRLLSAERKLKLIALAFFALVAVFILLQSVQWQNAKESEAQAQLQTQIVQSKVLLSNPDSFLTGLSELSYSLKSGATLAQASDAIDLVFSKPQQIPKLVIDSLGEQAFFSQDGKWLLLADEFPRVWNLETGVELKDLSIFGGNPLMKRPTRADGENSPDVEIPTSFSSALGGAYPTANSNVYVVSKDRIDIWNLADFSVRSRAGVKRKGRIVVLPNEEIYNLEIDDGGMILWSESKHAALRVKTPQSCTKFPTASVFGNFIKLDCQQQDNLLIDPATGKAEQQSNTELQDARGNLLVRNRRIKNNSNTSIFDILSRDVVVETAEKREALMILRKYRAFEVKFSADLTAIILIKSNTIEVRKILDGSLLVDPIRVQQATNPALSKSGMLTYIEAGTRLVAVDTTTNKNNPVFFAHPELIINYRVSADESLLVSQTAGKTILWCLRFCGHEFRLPLIGQVNLEDGSVLVQDQDKLRTIDPLSLQLSAGFKQISGTDLRAVKSGEFLWASTWQSGKYQVLQQIGANPSDWNRVVVPAMGMEPKIEAFGKGKFAFADAKKLYFWSPKTGELREMPNKNLIGVSTMFAGGKFLPQTLPSANAPCKYTFGREAR